MSIQVVERNIKYWLHHEAHEHLTLETSKHVVKHWIVCNWKYCITALFAGSPPRFRWEPWYKHLKDVELASLPLFEHISNTVIEVVKYCVTSPTSRYYEDKNRKQKAKVYSYVFLCRLARYQPTYYESAGQKKLKDLQRMALDDVLFQHWGDSQMKLDINKFPRFEDNMPETSVVETWIADTAKTMPGFVLNDDTKRRLYYFATKLETTKIMLKVNPRYNSENKCNYSAAINYSYYYEFAYDKIISQIHNLSTPSSNVAENATLNVTEVLSVKDAVQTQLAGFRNVGVHYERGGRDKYDDDFVTDDDKTILNSIRAEDEYQLKLRHAVELKNKSGLTYSPKSVITLDANFGVTGAGQVPKHRVSGPERPCYMFLLQRNGPSKVEITTRPEAHSYRAKTIGLNLSSNLVSQLTSDSTSVDDMVRQLLHAFDQNPNNTFPLICKQLESITGPDTFRVGAQKVLNNYRSHFDSLPENGRINVPALVELNLLPPSGSSLIVTYRDRSYHRPFWRGLPSNDALNGGLLVECIKWILNASYETHVLNDRAQAELTAQAAQAQIKKAFKDFRQSHPLDSRFKTLSKAAYNSNNDNTVINPNPPDLVLSVVDSTPNDDYTLDGMYQAHARRGAMPPGSYLRRGNTMMGPIPQPGCAVRVEDTLPLVPSDTGRAALLDWCPGAEDWHHNVFTPVKLSTLYHRFTSERTDDPKNALAFARELQDDTQLWGKLPARRFGQQAAVRAGVRAKKCWKANATEPLEGEHYKSFIVVHQTPDHELAGGDAHGMEYPLFEFGTDPLAWHIGGSAVLLSTACDTALKIASTYY